MAYLVHCGSEEAKWAVLRIGLPSNWGRRYDFAAEWFLGNPKTESIIPWFATVEDNHIPRFERVVRICSSAGYPQDVSWSADGRSHGDHVADDNVENTRCCRTGMLDEIYTHVSRIELEDFADTLFLFGRNGGE